MENKKIRNLEKKLIEENAFLSKEPGSEKNGIKKKPKLYPIPDEDSHMPIQEDSEEIKYQTKKDVS
ncbi:MAG: hypothetical protein IPJ16_00330 [Bacteroidales bacterium]|nr:hypothetical protein [Bacteroidales bacterium]